MRFAYRVLNRRTIEEIRGKIAKKARRNLFYRLAYAKDDKEVIAAWRADLDRLLHVFNVRSIGSVLPSLTSPFQTELAINTNVMVLEIHRTMVMGQEGSGGQHLSVSAALYSSTTEYLPSPRLKLGQLSRISRSTRS